MSKKELVKRYALFFLGLLITSFGVAFVTKASLGTSPISAIPYSLSLILPRLTMGNWTIIFSALLILIQIALLKKNSNWIEMGLQLVISVAFGYLIDFSMFLLGSFAPQMYVLKLLSLILGCAVIAFGAYFQVTADVVMLPGDATVRAFVKVTGKEFGTIRVIFDTTLAVTGGVLCLIFLHKLIGVREGTVIAALITGNMVKVFVRLLRPLTEKLFPQTAEDKDKTASAPTDHFVLTIAREYASGGREIGQEVAKKLGIAYYDSELIHLAAVQSGIPENIIEKKEQVLDAPVMHDFYQWYTSALTEEDLPAVEKIYHAEAAAIRSIASKEDCVIVGRLANFILEDTPHHVSAFIRSDLDSKVELAKKRDNLTDAEARRKVQKVDRERANHCRHFTHKEWTDGQNYDITFNTGKIGYEQTISMIVDFARPKLTQAE